MERATAADDGAHDRATATRTRLARARVDLELPLHPSLVPACVDVVTWRRAAETDAFAKRPADRLMETRDRGRGQRAGLAERTAPRTPERLDGVGRPAAGRPTLTE